MPAHSKLWYLRHFRLLDALSEQQMRLVQRLTRMAEIKRGQPIYLPGDPSDQVFLLKAGVVKIATSAPDGRDVILAFLRPGDVFGELAVVDESPRDHVAVAYADAVICAMDKPFILQLIRECPELGYRITKLLGFRLRTFRARVEDLLCKSAAARIAHTLCDLAREHGVPDAQGCTIPFRLSQRDLANLTGVTRETVNIILQDLRHRGLIETNGRSLRLTDPRGLRTVR
ncbi:MAG: helix-turn-helix domain-containing protein [Luteitalea sp.]|nr:helix-turn-helix domain-containing protein [Luteitalea sp.]